MPNLSPANVGNVAVLRQRDDPEEGSQINMSMPVKALVLSLSSRNYYYYSAKFLLSSLVPEGAVENYLTFE